jgi:hopanoid-associated phosphorylase
MAEGPVIAVTGLRREARIMAGPGVLAIAGGGDGARLEAEIEAACAAGASGVLSIGLCGALARALRPGDWIVGRSAVTPDGRIETDPAWSERLISRLNPAVTGPICGSDVMVADVEAKRKLREAAGGLAVDMETHIAAHVAKRHGLPFAIARNVSDASDRSLPKAAQAGMKADGGMDVGAVIKALARDPGELPALIRTALEAEVAFRALLRGRQLLGGALVGPGSDFGELLLDMA